MAFKQGDANRLIARCHRRCCVCHRFCGVKLELDHIEASADGGSDEIENAIPVCFECHAEIHLYNDLHPRGRKFRPEELREHKREWLRICEESPEIFVEVARSQDVGPIQALVDEMEFNATVAERTEVASIGALFLVTQFEKAISQGVFSLLPDLLKNRIAGVYATLRKANADLTKMQRIPWGGPTGPALQHARNDAKTAIEAVRSDLTEAREDLLKYLGREDPEA